MQTHLQTQCEPFNGARYLHNMGGACIELRNETYLSKELNCVLYFNNELTKSEGVLIIGQSF